uniref:Oxidoreductase n=2 Tax=Hirondellea gigas TaxID=1518452 RepID=A0A6A7G2D8_9CRUS
MTSQTHRRAFSRLSNIISSFNRSNRLSPIRRLSTSASSDTLPSTFKGLIVEKTRGNPPISEIRDLTPSQLPDFDVTVKVEYSTLNYKDALAITGAPGVVRSYPIVPGIDYAGTVVSDRSGTFEKGTKVILTGHGVGEKYWGGYAEFARAKPSWLVKLPESMTTKQAMSIGTAGFTAMLCINALEKQGLSPKHNFQTKVLVTGASGGVGVTAIALLASLGYRVTASSGRKWTHETLTKLGSKHIIDRFSDEKVRPIDKELWDGVVDSVGGVTLAKAISQCKTNCAVAACGLAGGTSLPTSVFPFILRGVALLGIDSVYYPNAKRDEVWSRIAAKVPWNLFESATTVRRPNELSEMANQLLSGKSEEIIGRTVVDCGAF